MKIASLLLGAIVFFVAGFGSGAFLQQVWRFDLVLNDVSRHILLETRGAKGELTSLVPEVFEEGQTREWIELRLDRSGYQQGHPAHGGNYQNLGLSDAEIWRREAVVARCDASLLVFLAFSPTDQLRGASGTHLHEGCV